jgi:AAA domain
MAAMLLWCSMTTAEIPYSLLTRIRDRQWLDRQDFPPMRYAVPGIVPEGLSVLAGAPKVGKSWMVLDWLLASPPRTAARSAGSGHRRAGGAVHGARGRRPADADADAVTLSDAAVQPVVARRCDPGEVPIPDRGHAGQLVPTIAEWLEIYQSGLIVVDTLGRALPPALNGEAPYSRDYGTCRS